MEKLKRIIPEELKEKYPELAEMTFCQIVQSEEFKKIFKDSITKLKKGRKTLKAKNPQLRRSMIDRLEEQNLLDIEFFGPEFCLCVDKESRLSAEMRTAIVYLGINVYNDTIKKLMKKYDEKV